MIYKSTPTPLSSDIILSLILTIFFFRPDPNLTIVEEFKEIEEIELSEEEQLEYQFKFE